MRMKPDKKMLEHIALLAQRNDTEIKAAVHMTLEKYEPKGITRQGDIAHFIRVFAQELGYLEDYIEQVEYQLVRDVLQ